VNRHPLLGDYARGEPEPEAEEVAGDGVQCQRSVSLVAKSELGLIFSIVILCIS
jgi:hypothetical protein